MNLTVLCFVLVAYISSICSLVCCGLHRKVPINYALLTLFTFCMSYLVSSVAIVYNQEIVVEAMFLTSAVVVGVTVYAYTTKTDYTIYGAVRSIGGCVCVSAFLLLCIFPTKGTDMVYMILSVILFSFFLVCDTQMII